jgi:hypothetical protein
LRYSGAMLALLLPVLAAAAAAPPAGDDLSVFSRLLGHCWEGQMAADTLDVHCFETLYDGAHVRDRHVVLVKGAPAYKGVTYYSREGRRVTFVYLNSHGGVGQGEASPDAAGVCFKGRMRGAPDAGTQAIASCWRWQADGGYVVTAKGAGPVRFVLSRKRL